MELPVLRTCDGCGACCRTVSVPPFRIDPDVNEPVLKGVPQTLIDEFLPAWRVRLHVSDSPCLWFDEQSLRCRHYELRPDACREFEINSPSCEAVRREFRVG
jgi:Fe-S-cluster containining protein